MKKYTSIGMLILLLLSTSISFASPDLNLSGHWAESLIDKDFVGRYFYPLSSDENQIFAPNENINEEDFVISLYTLIREYDSQSVESNNESIEAVQAITYFVEKGLD